MKALGGQGEGFWARRKECVVVTAATGSGAHAEMRTIRRWAHSPHTLSWKSLSLRCPLPLHLDCPQWDPPSPNWMVPLPPHGAHHPEANRPMALPGLVAPAPLSLWKWTTMEEKIVVAPMWDPPFSHLPYPYDGTLSSANLGIHQHPCFFLFYLFNIKKLY